MLAIFKREFKSYFQTVIGWLFIAVSLCIYGLYFYISCLYNGQPDIASPVSSITFICLITIPILSMRCLADEKRTRTDQLVLTSPVTVGKLVMGKFLALAAIFTITVAIYAVTPLFLRIFGPVSFRNSYIALFGYWLFGLTFISICVFVSSLTESQVIAAVLSFLFLFVGYLMSGICSMISQTGNIVTKILSCYDLSTPVNDFFNGTIDLTSVVYYLSVIALFLFFATQSIQKRRWTVSKKTWKTGAFSTGFIAVVAALVIAVNFVIGAVPDRITKLDLTAQKLYSITDDTRKLLSGLKEDVTIYVLAKESSSDETLKRTLQCYADASKHVTVSYKDPAVSPKFYSKYTDDAPYQNSLIVVCGKRSKVVSYGDIYEYSSDSSQYSMYTQQSSSPTGYDGEGKVTSAIQYVTDETMPVLYEIEGHGETALAGSFSEAIEKANITTSTMNLMDYDEIPEDAAGIVISGPTKDFSQDDAKKVKDYLKKGGKALILGTYTNEKMENFYSILEAYGVTAENGLVVDSDKSRYYQQPFFLLPQMGASELLDGCSDSYLMVPYSIGFTHKDVADGSQTVTSLLTTSDDSYAKKDVENAESFDKAKGDVDGPFEVGLDIVASNETQTDADTDKDAETESETEKTDTEIMLFGSSLLFTDEADQYVSGNNLNLFTNCINKFKSEDNPSIVIPVKAYDSSTLTITPIVVIIAGLVCIVFLPLLLLAVGIVIWVGRRKR
ncbi:MAG: Gldg family protein [Lachnospiraceae bacterium]